jgi:hypothetical protein
LDLPTEQVFTLCHNVYKQAKADAVETMHQKP